VTQKPVSIARAQHKQRTQSKQKLGDRVRTIADRLKQETDVQIKATSRILGAAAQIAENHDRLIDEVVDMVEEDIDRPTHTRQTNTYTIDLLKQQFKTLREAKDSFGIQAKSWVELVNKLNNSSIPERLSSTQSQTSVIERLDVIESELKIMRNQLGEIEILLKQLLERE
jgi:hypothetical protein